MKHLILLAFITISSVAIAQETPINDKNGVYLSYKLTKLKQDSKKDYYLLTCKVKNLKGDDLFYEAPENKVNPFFASVTVRNAGSDIYFTGTESKLSVGKKVLFYLKKGDSITIDKEIKIDKGVEPILTSEFLSDMKPVIEYK